MLSCVSVVKNAFVFFLCGFASLRLCVKFCLCIFGYSPLVGRFPLLHLPDITRQIYGSTLPKLRHFSGTFSCIRRNGIRRRSYGRLPPFCAISAPRSLTSAALNSHVGGSKGASRPPFRQIKLHILHNLHIGKSTLYGTKKLIAKSLIYL